jgi:ribosomal protein S6
MAGRVCYLVKKGRKKLGYIDHKNNDGSYTIIKYSKNLDLNERIDMKIDRSIHKLELVRIRPGEI